MKKNREALLTEAQMQTSAIKRIGIWRAIAIAVSTVGVGMVYAGAAGGDVNLLFCIPGSLLFVFGVMAAWVFNLGMIRGRKNVEKILKVAEGSSL